MLRALNTTAKGELSLHQQSHRGQKDRGGAMAFIVDECIHRIEAEIIRTQRFPESAGKRKRLAQLEAMLEEYEQAENANTTEF
jgi:hypothetical protein